MPSTSLLLTNKHVDRQAKLISEDARCLKFLERLAELHATDRTRGKKKEENKSSLPKPLNVPAGMTIQEARKARLAAQEPEEEEKEERKVPVARFGKKTKEEAAAQEQAKGSPEKNTSPVKRRKTRSVFDKMKKEKKWVTGINPMVSGLGCLLRMFWTVDVDCNARSRTQNSSISRIRGPS